MRTPVVLVAGQEGVGRVLGVLARGPGTAVVTHRFDGQVVVRTVSADGSASDWPIEVRNGCVACTIHDDLLTVLSGLHRRDDVHRIVVGLLPWLEPEPVCWAIDNSPAAHDVAIEAVVGCVDTENWLAQAVGDDDLADGRTVAQVVVGQAEFADVLVLAEPDVRTLAALRRLAPRARITVGPDRVDMAIEHIDPHSHRGRSIRPHDPLLAGEPPLEPEGEIGIVEFSARRPFHPHRLHIALDLLLDGVVRTRGRAWLANRPDDVMWIESAGGGLRFSSAGKWLAAMDSQRRAYIDPQRRAIAATHWDDRFGDRHVSMAILVCGANPAEVIDALRGALLTDAELARPADWPGYPDPFGDWHEDPCADRATSSGDTGQRGHGDAGER